MAVFAKQLAKRLHMTGGFGVFYMTDVNQGWK